MGTGRLRNGFGPWRQVEVVRQGRAGNPAAAEEAGAGVEDAGLAWGDAGLGEGELDPGVAGLAADAAGDGGLVVAVPDLDRLAVGRRGAGPARVGEIDARAGAGRARADDDAAAGGVEGLDVEGLAVGDAQAAALADRVAGDALVPAERAAVGVDDLARLGRVGAEAGDEVAVVALRDEADVLALGLVGERQAEAAGVGAGLGLGQA